MFKALIDFWKRMQMRDPILHCGVYRKHGCAHVDGMLCNTETCTELKEFNTAQPVTFVVQDKK